MKTLNHGLFYAKRWGNSEARERMTIEIAHTWPLTAIPTPGEKAVQEKSAANPPSQYVMGSTIHVTRIESESTTFWEKGTFIDLYM